MGLFEGLKKINKKNDTSKDDSINDSDKTEFSDLKGDRSNVYVSGRVSNKKKAIIVVIFLMIIFFLLITFFTFYIKSKKKDESTFTLSSADATQLQKNDRNDSSLATLKDHVDKSLTEILKEKEDEEKAQAQANDDSHNDSQDDVTDTIPPIVSNSSKSDEMSPQMRRLKGATLIKDISNPVQTKNIDNLNDDVYRGDFLQGSNYADGSVGFLKDRTYLLSAGTTMPCVLKTKIVTSYSGVTLCQLTKNVYSDNGKTILMRAGALLQGQQTKAITQGIARVFVTWDTVKDGNVSVRINALGADGLGASGVPAWIDSHFWERFGGAIMLSFLNDSFAVASNRLSKTDDNNSLSIDNTKDTASTMAELALQNSINIPPTAYINQGTLMSVIVPRNIDFSPVYGVK